MTKQKTLAIKEDTKNVLDEFKKFACPNGSVDEFINYLIDTNPRTKEFIQSKQEKIWKDEFIEQNETNPNVSWSDFKERKLKEGLNGKTTNKTIQ